MVWRNPSRTSEITLSLQTIALTLQKRRINGPFKRVAFIDPYPDKLLRAPSFLATNLLVILVLLIAAGAFVIGVFGATTEFSNMFGDGSVAAIGGFVHRQVGQAAQYFQTGRMEFLVNLLSAMFLLVILLIAGINWLYRRLVAMDWKKKCKTAPAQLLDSEIQEMQILKKGLGGSGPDHYQLKTCHVLRIKVEFSHLGRAYEATPSVVNRLSPGSVGIHFKTREKCEALLATYHNALEVEFDPHAPLDCEIKGYLDRLLHAYKWPWLIIGAFSVTLIVLVFSRIVIHILRAG